MTLSFPRTDIMSAVDWSTDTRPLRLVSRQELSSRQANGKTYAKDFGSALWAGEFSTVPLLNADALRFEAMLNSLDGAIGTFEAGDMRQAAQYPAAYPDGDFDDTGTIATINANSKAISLENLPVGFKINVGCYLSFAYGVSRALHQVMESAIANTSGVTGEFEVRPHIRPGATIGTAVRFKQPRGIFCLVPDSIDLSMNDSVSSIITFQAAQTL